MIGKKQVYGEIPGVPLSGAVRAGDFVFVSGQVPFDEDGKIVTGDITTVSYTHLTLPTICSV